MLRVSFETANDWQSHPELSRSVPWRTASGTQYVVFEAEVDGSRWTIRLNDFPDEPLYTLLIDGDEVMHFDGWPKMWIQPELPKKK
jgi:hypothetical protein